MYATCLCNILLLATAIAPTFGAVNTVASFERKISPDIVAELKDFINLIPETVVDELIAKHYLIDSNFREVLKYVRSADFRSLLQRAQQIPEVVEILDFLHLLVESAPAAAANTYDHDVAKCQIPLPEPRSNFEQEEQLDFVLLNRIDAQETPARPLGTRTVPDVRTFSGFVEELVEHLPRNEYVQLINQKRQKNASFAQFYAELRSAQLRPMVDVALKATNLAEIIKRLSSNGVDVKSLESTAFKVIGWGPTV